MPRLNCLEVDAYRNLSVLLVEDLHSELHHGAAITCRRRKEKDEEEVKYKVYLLLQYVQ